MKEFLIIGTTIVSLVTSGATAITTNTDSAPVHTRGEHVSVAMIHKAELKAEAQAELLKQQALQAKTDEVNTAIKKLKSHVGKTWYVFSGNTPSGWDCSGLTMWFYEQLGVSLEHRASKQIDAGTKVSEPKIGDIVAFTYKGSKSAYHVGIYIGDGNMIHAPKKGHLTRVENVEQFGGDYSKISYIRIVETL